MGTFDWNNDGKQDWHDDALFHTVINKDSKSDDSDDGGFPTLRSSSSYRYTPSKPSPPPPPPTYHRRNNTIQIGGLTKLAIGVTIFLCISFLFTGYAHIIGDLLGIGVLVCFFTSWLESNP